MVAQLETSNGLRLREACPRNRPTQPIRAAQPQPFNPNVAPKALSYEPLSFSSPEFSLMFSWPSRIDTKKPTPRAGGSAGQTLYLLFKHGRRGRFQPNPIALLPCLNGLGLQSRR